MKKKIFFGRVSKYSLSSIACGLICLLGALLLSIGYCVMPYYTSPLFYVTTQQSIPIPWLLRCISTVSQIVWFLCGSASLLYVPFLLFCSHIFFWSCYKREQDRIIAFVLLIAFSGLIGARFSYKLMPTPFLCGGIFSQHMLRICMRYCDPFILTIALLIGWCGSVIILSRLSYVEILSWCSSIGRARVLSMLKKFIHATYTMVQRIACKAGTFIVRSLHPSAFDKAGQAIIAHELVFESLRESEETAALDTDNTAPIGELVATIVPDPSAYQDDVPQKKIVASYTFPPVEVLQKQIPQPQDDKEQFITSAVLEEKLERFGIKGKVVSIKKGPVITLFEYKPTIDTKISKILSLEDDLALALQAITIRIIAPIPGTSVVGFEVANKIRQQVLFSTIVSHASFSGSRILPLVLGVDTIGAPVVLDLVSMPHLLVAGATGSGKSVALSVFLAGLLYACKPSFVKFILIDPKRLEFGAFADIPHLLFPIVTDPKEAAPLLRWVVQTMELRYKLLAAVGVRNIADYHIACKTNKDLEPMPYIVIMIDELSDLMMVVGKHIEESIVRIAQMARAAGIHMIVATQRPSVDVITGIIKVNFPSRISFKVSSKIDSRTILDDVGAQNLLGKGDMLYNDGALSLKRVHGAFLTDKEIGAITSYVRSQEKPSYLNIQEELACAAQEDFDDVDQSLYKQIIIFLETIDEVSISLLQRKFKIGYNRSARIIERLESEGIVMPSQGGKIRKVIHSK